MADVQLRASERCGFSDIAFGAALANDVREDAVAEIAREMKSKFHFASFAFFAGNQKCKADAESLDQ